MAVLVAVAVIIEFGNLALNVDFRHAVVDHALQVQGLAEVEGHL